MPSRGHATYGAPWGFWLKATTAFSALILSGIPVIGILSGPAADPTWTLGMVVLPLTLLAGAAFFTIRGYELTPGALYVRRLGWRSEIDLAGLVSAEADPSAMERSFRTLGNGGLFCFAGRFRNKKLGSYHAFATDPKRSVVLRFPDRTVVVTPDRPAELVEVLTPGATAAR